MIELKYFPWEKDKERLPTKPGGFDEEIRKLEQEFEKAVGEGRNFSYGFSEIIVNGKPVRQEIFAPEGKTEATVKHLEEEEREPLIDVIEGKNETNILIELPGIEKKDIKLTSEGNTLEVRVDTEARKYHKEIKLAHAVKAPSAEYRNGVLEVIVSRTAPEDVKIK